MAGLTEVPVVIMELDDKKAAQVALVENIQREDLNAIDTAKAFQAIIFDYAMTQDELSGILGMSRSLVANTLRLLELPDSVAKLVQDGTLSAGHGRTILGLKDKSKCDEVAEIIVKKGLNVRDTEALVKKYNKPASSKPVPDEPIVDYTLELSKKMTNRLGSRVKISGKGKSRRLEIAITDDKMLDEIVKKLCGDNIFDED